MSPSFYTSLKVINTNIISNYNLTNKLLTDKLLPKNLFPVRSNILLLQCTYVDIMITKEKYTETINLIIDRIGSERFVFKPHPDQMKQFGKETACMVMPDFISANLLYYRFNAYLGYESAALAEAANMGVLSISLVNVIPSYDNGKKDSIYKYLLSLSDNVKFPCSVEETVALLNA